MSNIRDYEWDEEAMDMFQLTLEDHLEDLWIRVDDDAVDELGLPFDGCEICVLRATLAFTLPRIIDLYEQNHIRRLQHADKETT